MAFSFGTSGATPQGNPLSAGSLNLGSTPQSKALNTASASAPINWNALQMQPASSTQPLKNQTVIHPDGTKVTHTYDTEAKPVKPAKPAEPPTYPGILGSLTSTAQQGSQPGQQYTQQTAAASTPNATQTGLLQKTADASTPNQTQTGLVNSVQNSGQGNLAIGQKAADIASNYGKAISDVGGMGARAEAGQLTTGTSPVGEGNAAVTAQTASAQQQALAQGEAAALQGTGQQLTAQQQNTGALTEALGGANTQQGQQITGLGTAAGAANTQQAQQITGLNSAAGQANTAQGQALSGLTSAADLAKPQLGSIGQVPYSPINLQQGSPLGAPGGTAADAARVAGQFQGAQAAAAAPGQAQASNIQTAGTTPTNTAATGYGNAVQSYQSANTAYQTATMQAQNVQKILADTGINSSTSQDYNTAINALSGRLGSEKQTAFITGLNEMKQAYTNLLSSVGAATPTVNGQQATDIFNPGSTPKQIDAAIAALNDASYAKLQPLYQQAQTYSSALSSGSQSGGGSSGPVTAGGYHFVQDASGKWVAQ